MVIQFALDQSNFDLPLFQDHSSYIDYCLELAVSQLKDYDSIAELENDQIKFLNKKRYFLSRTLPGKGYGKEKWIEYALCSQRRLYSFSTGSWQYEFSCKNAIPIKAWKYADTTPLADNCMHMPDIQKGHKGYAQLFFSVNK